MLSSSHNQASSSAQNLIGDIEKMPEQGSHAGKGKRKKRSRAKASFNQMLLTNELTRYQRLAINFIKKRELLDLFKHSVNLCLIADEEKRNNLAGFVAQNLVDRASGRQVGAIVPGNLSIMGVELQDCQELSRLLKNDAKNPEFWNHLQAIIKASLLFSVEVRKQQIMHLIRLKLLQKGKVFILTG